MGGDSGRLERGKSLGRERSMEKRERSGGKDKGMEKRDKSAEKKKDNRHLPDRKRDLGLFTPQQSLGRNVTFSALSEYASKRGERKALYGDYDEYDDEEDTFGDFGQVSPTTAIRTERGNLNNHGERREQRLQHADSQIAKDGEKPEPENHGPEKSSNSYAEYVRTGVKGFRGNESRLRSTLRRSINFGNAGRGLRESRGLTGNRRGAVEALGNKMRALGSKFSMNGGNSESS